MRQGPIIAAGGGARAFAGAFLIMASTLASLDIGLTAAAARSSLGCLARFEDPVTIVVTGSGLESADAAAARAREILSGLPEGRGAKILDPSDCDGAIARAMGAASGPDADMRLLTVTAAPPPGAGVQLEAALRAQSLSARIDDHRGPSSALWRAGVGGMAAATGVGLLLCLAVALICGAMTRREIGHNRVAVELMLLAGAKDSLIVGLFRGRAWRLGLWAGVIGVAVAAALLGLWSRYGAGTPLDALRPLAHEDLVWSLGWPVAAGLISWAASGGAGLGALRRLP
jgi:cell division protein FtsX